MNYYDEILEKINNETNPHLQLSYIQEELSMPYIDKTFEKQLLTLQQNIKSYLPQFQKQYDLKEMLYNPQLVQNALEKLRNTNIRGEIGIIEQYLSGDNDSLIKGMLILLLIDQQYYEEVKMLKDGFEIIFNPNQIELPIENDVIINMMEKINDDLMHYPHIKNHCNDKLIEKAIRHLPFSFDEGDEKNILNEVYTEILSAFNEKALLEKIIT